MIKKLALCVLITGLTASTVFADNSNTKFQKKHPRRAQVLNRANNEESKNNAASANGQITQKQDKKLNREDQAIKRQEQADAAANGGHITKSEQRDLNREENGVNRQRARDEKRDAKNGTAPAGAPAAGTSN